MKTLELEQMGVQEMDAVEIMETDGGFWRIIVGALILEWDDFKAGIKEGWKAAS